MHVLLRDDEQLRERIYWDGSLNTGRGVKGVEMRNRVVGIIPFVAIPELFACIDS